MTPQGLVIGQNRNLGGQSDLVRAGAYMPTGALAANMQPGLAGNTAISLTSGTLNLFRGLLLPAGRAVSSITFVSGATALATGTHQWFALYDLSRNKLAVTVNDTSAAWGGLFPKTLALSAPYTPPTDMEVYVGITVVATTPPSLSGAGTTGGIRILTPIFGGSSTAGLTDPASAPATAGALTAGNIAYCYVS